MVTVGIAYSETAADCFQSQSGTFLGGGEFSGIFYLKDEMAGFHLGGNEESEAVRTFTRTVFEGIFHDGLQDEAGDKSVSSTFGSGDSGL
jgi:hypothetical protein